MNQLKGTAIAKSVTFLFCVAIASCKPAIVHKLTTAAYIIGPDNIQRVDRHEPASVMNTAPNEELIKSVAATAVLIVSPMTTGETRFCSGNIYKRPSGPVVLTNRHCFAPDKEHSAESNGVDPWACEKTQIYRAFDPVTALPSVRNSCLRGSLTVNPLVDLAWFKLDGPGTEPDAPDAPDALPKGLELRPKDPQPADRIGALIVHFPDVESQRVRMDLNKFPGAPMTIPRISLTWEDCKTAGYFRVETYSVDPSLPYSIRHTCDMIKGSSGSSLVDATTGESLGVNWGGIKFGDGDGEVYNIATRATMAASFLTLGSTELDHLLLTVAKSPPEGTVGNGESDAVTQRSGKSRRVSAAGCARIQSHDSRRHNLENQDEEPWQSFDIGWLVVGFVVLWLSNHRRARHT
ncbi:hypothetical protein EBZ80_14400 [bacterium]|nr:hypothetical protein [bacterium]